jgi:hypothetical protein
LSTRLNFATLLGQGLLLRYIGWLRRHRPLLCERAALLATIQKKHRCQNHGHKCRGHSVGSDGSFVVGLLFFRP